MRYIKNYLGFTVRQFFHDSEVRRYLRRGGSGSGSTSTLSTNYIDFTDAIPFDSFLTDMGTKTVDADITFTVNETDSAIGNETEVVLVGDGSHTIDVSQFNVIGLGAFDPSLGTKNILVFKKLSLGYCVVISKVTIEMVPPPVPDVFEDLIPASGYTETSAGNWFSNTQINTIFNKYIPALTSGYIVTDSGSLSPLLTIYSTGATVFGLDPTPDAEAYTGFKYGFYWSDNTGVLYYVLNGADTSTGVTLVTGNKVRLSTIFVSGVTCQLLLEYSPDAGTTWITAHDYGQIASVDLYLKVTNAAGTDKSLTQPKAVNVL